MQVNLDHLRDENFLKLLLESLLSDLNINLYSVSSPSGIEYEAFAYVLENDLVPAPQNNKQASYDHDSAAQTVSDLKTVWTAAYTWLLDGSLITAQEWKPIYNGHAEKFNRPLLT